jgi:hypothetical protein
LRENEKTRLDSGIAFPETSRLYPSKPTKNRNGSGSYSK